MEGEVGTKVVGAKDEGPGVDIDGDMDFCTGIPVGFAVNGLGDL